MSGLPPGFEEVTDESPGALPPGFVEVPEEPTLASKASKFFSERPSTPEIPQSGLAALATSYLKRVAGATFPTPTSQEELATPLDPRVGRAGMSGIVEGEAARVGDSVRGSAQKISKELVSEIQNPVVRGLIRGTMREDAPVQPQDKLLAGAVEVGADVLADSLRPSEWANSLGAEGIAPGAKLLAARAGKTALVQWGEDVGVGLARRSMGYTKRMFKDPKDIARANSVAKEMLEKKVISHNSEVMLDKALALEKQAGDKIGGILKQAEAAGVPALDSEDLATEIVAQLHPGKTTGAYAKDIENLGEVVATVAAHGPGPVTWKSAQQLKNKIAELGKFDVNTDAAKARMYQRAYGIVRQAMENSLAKAESVVGKGGKDLLAEYVENKGIYGKAADAVDALMNRVSSDLGNNVWGLRETIIASNLLAEGRVGAAATGMAVKTAFQKGPALAAKVAYSTANWLKRISPPNRGTALGILVRSGILKEAMAYPGVFKKAGVDLSTAEEPPTPKPTTPPIPEEETMVARGPSNDLAAATMPIRSDTPEKYSPSMKAFRKGLEAYLAKDMNTAKSAWMDAYAKDKKNLQAKRALERIAMKEGRDSYYYTVERRK